MSLYNLVLRSTDFNREGTHLSEGETTVDPNGWSYAIFSTIFLITDLFIRIGLSVRVIMRRRSYGVSFAWLIVILLFPFLGAFIYLLFGENRLSERRSARIKESAAHYQHWLETLDGRAPVNWQDHNIECRPLHNLARRMTGLPAMDGNHLELLEEPETFMTRIIEDIDNARSTCHLQFYIWEEGGRVDEVIHALYRAVERGVTCRLLLDAIGSRTFLASNSARQMMKAGIRVQEALPAGLIKVFFARIDIRNHRKIAVIDGSIAYTGSQNMADPKYFKQSAGVGNWVDVMVRITGPVVETLAGTFISDWFLETNTERIESRTLNEDIDQVRSIADIHSPEECGHVAVQLVPSGPGFAHDAIHSLLLTTIYAARKQLILTTPYFIPDEALLTALESAACRGVDVSIITPDQNDSKLAEYAARARFDKLTEAGVSIYRFQGGLLHSKTITVDGDFALFGSVNLDMRSFWLNFETTLLIYDRDICSELQSLQLSYIASSQLLDIETFSQRSMFERFKENLVLLLGPLL